MATNSQTDEVKKAISFWSEQTGTPKEWIDRAFDNVAGMAAGQECFALVLNPLSDPMTGVAHTQLKGRELADHVSSTGRVAPSPNSPIPILTASFRLKLWFGRSPPRLSQA